jgi:hypothetical protein
MNAALVTVDVAHPPRHPDVVEAELQELWHRVRNRSEIRVLKIVHGHGSSGRGGTTREVVRNWLFRRRAEVRAVIEGEHYTVSNPVAVDLLREVGSMSGEDLGRDNRGITLVWVR